jgi:hypothetical protein
MLLDDARNSLKSDISEISAHSPLSPIPLSSLVAPLDQVINIKIYIFLYIYIYLYIYIC